jgi:hypothetical protein
MVAITSLNRFSSFAIVGLIAFGTIAGCAGSGGGATGTAGTNGGGGVAGTTGAGRGGSTGQAGAGAGQAGTTGAAGNGQAGTTGAAGAGAGQAGTTGAAGNGQAGATGAAGSSVAGSSGGATAGTTGSAGTNGTAGTTGTGGTSANGDCTGLPLCDTFESGTVGQPPSASLWTIINDGGGTGPAVIDSMGAHGSSKSVKVTSTGRTYIRNSSVISTLGSVAHVRYYVRFMSTLPSGHGAMMATHPTPADQYTQTPEFRFGSQDMVFHWNNTQSDVNVPVVSPDGDATSFKPQANTWYCVELTIDRSTGHFSASVDGSIVAGLTEDGVSTPNVDDAWLATANVTSTYSMLADFSLGWASYGAGGMTLWFDDVALSASPIGCVP